MQENQVQFTSFMGGVEYFILLACMVVIIASLFLWRQKIMGGANNFNFLQKNKTDDIKIIAQRVLDVKNRLLLIECEGNRYLIILGTNHSSLIDKLPIHSNQMDFSEYLKKQSRSDESSG